MKQLFVGVLAFLLFSLPVDAKSITANGMDQKDLHTFLSNVTTLANELKADHATFRSAVTGNEALAEELKDDVNLLTVTASENRTAVIELIDDVNLLNVTASENRAAIIELIDDHATFITAWNTLLAKMDADFADVSNASTDYAASVTTPSALAASDPTAGPTAAISASDPTAGPTASVSASDPPSAPAALSASTDLTLDNL